MAPVAKDVPTGVPGKNVELPYTDDGVSALVNEKLSEFPGGSRSVVALLE